MSAINQQQLLAPCHNPGDTMSNLPIEILDHVFRHLSLHDLSIIMQTSRLFYNISAPILYDSIPSLPLARSNSCLSSLCNNEFTVSLVRSLTIDWRRHVIHDCVTQFGSTADLLNECLRRLHRLTALTLILDHAYVCGQTFSGCSFTLSSLTTSFHCDSDFIAFLESQPNIVTLDLTCQERPPPFTINPSALPMLKSFSSNYVSPDFLGEFLRGRPVEQVDLASCFVLNLSVLDILSLSTRPIKRLTICEVDGSAQDVVQALRTRAPHVEDLYMGFFKKQVMSVSYSIPS